ncbi:phosphotransferase [Nitriliruptor alkaliphilus]|uniref:phosphotransferase n=1 Tax=Nitriliruptor alkaliphilus TaxID=427918 RepID=UPI000698FEBD|nr:phosphotransferase [Nitriliruptor alkaliphilus]
MLLSLVWIRRQRPGTGTDLDHVGRYSIRLPSSYTPETVLFDLERQRVLRIPRGPVAAARIDVPTRMAPHVRIASFEVHASGRYFVEELIEGATLADVDEPDRRLDAIVTLLAGYTDLARAERSGSASSLLAATLAEASTAALPPRLAAWLETMAPHLLQRAAAWPLVPCHADLTADNVMIRDGEPVLIDFEWARHLPFFYDPLWLILREASDGRGHDLLEACLDGRLDPAISALCDAAASPPEDVTTLLVTTLLMRCYTAATKHGVTDRDRFERHIARGWTALDAHVDVRSSAGDDKSSGAPQT